MIDVKGLTKYYGSKIGVQDISFHIADGDMVGLLGPNGAGKSTIMKMLAGYQMPTAGTIEIDGQDLLDHYKEIIGTIGFMPENPPLYFDMEVEASLAFSAAIKNVKKSDIKSEVQRVMELTSIVPVKDRIIGNLSKGYKQRVGLAQTLLGMPKIIILDEPTSGLDPRQITDVRDLLLKLSKDHTIIISSHILAEITQICDKVIIINKGRLAAADTMENLRKGETDSGRFVLRTTACAQTLQDALKDIPEITGIVKAQDETAGENTYYVLGNDSDALRGKTAKALVESGIDIMEISKSKVSLEQIFLRLTNENLQNPQAKDERNT
ncbi:MAG: ABC transporter ATP-binding protein [Ruthenibacterium sp.]